MYRVQLLREGYGEEKGTLQHILGSFSTTKIDGRLTLNNAIATAKDFFSKALGSPDAFAIYGRHDLLIYSELMNKDLPNEIISTTPIDWRK